jgi:MFS family permease
MVTAAAACPWPGLLPVIYLLAGAAMTVANASANADLQGATLPARRGRAVSLFMLAMRGGLALGALLAGVTVSVFGVRAALGANGLVAMGVLATVGLAWMRAQSRVRPARAVRVAR